jgi:hydrogenase maturation factor
VIAEKEGIFVVENHDGTRQEVKSILPLAIGDYVITQQNIAIEKIAAEQAEELFNILNQEESDEHV